MAEHLVLKLLVYLFNCILFLCGLALVVGGSMVQIQWKDFLSSMDSKIFIAPILLIAAGVIMVLIAIFGCFGTRKRLPWTLIVFAILLAIVFLIEIAGSIAAYFERSSVKSFIDQRMTNSFAAIKAGNSSGEVDKVLWDRLQNQLHCCGVRNYNDWLGRNLKIPESCCRDKSRTNCADLSADMRRVCDRPDNVDTCPIFTKGCLDTAEDYAKDNIGTVGGIGFGIAAFQVLGVVLAACLARKIREDNTL